jgi:hypothetical protein
MVHRAIVMTTLTDVRITGKPLVLATSTEVDALEAKLWITFPKGYREYVTELGEGVLGGDLVRIYPPWRIAKELDEWRGRIAKYWFWDKSRAVLPKERALECVILGDTTNGDEIVFHSSRPGTLFVLPRDTAKADVLTGDLWVAVDHLCKEFTARDFVPFDSRKEKKRETEKVVDPEGESGDALAARAKEWAKRHGLRKNAQHELRDMLKDDDIKGVTKKVSAEQKTTLLYEALVIDGDNPSEGYVAVFQIDDKKTGTEIGRYTWHHTDGSFGGTYEPHFTNIAKLKKGK